MTFFMFGRYSPEATERLGQQWTALVQEEIRHLGGRVQEIYALLGEYDVVLVVELPHMAEAMQASLALKRRTGVAFFTSAAMSIEEFDRQIAHPAAGS